MKYWNQALNLVWLRLIGKTQMCTLTIFFNSANFFLSQYHLNVTFYRKQLIFLICQLEITTKVSHFETDFLVKNQAVQNIQLLTIYLRIIMKKRTGTIRTFIFRSFKNFCQRFVSTPEASSGHTKFSHKLHYMGFFKI